MYIRIYRSWNLQLSQIFYSCTYTFMTYTYMYLHVSDVVYVEVLFEDHN